MEVSSALCFAWAGYLVHRDVLPPVHNIVARNEHCVQRTLPVRTVFFVYIIIRWTRGGGGRCGCVGVGVGVWVCALLSGFSRITCMRAMHRLVAKAYSGTPHSVQATVKVLHHLSYQMPAPRCIVTARVGRWMEQHAYWAGDAATKRILVAATKPHGGGHLWCMEWGLFQLAHPVGPLIWTVGAKPRGSAMCVSDAPMMVHYFALGVNWSSCSH